MLTNVGKQFFLYKYGFDHQNSTLLGGEGGGGGGGRLFTSILVSVPTLMTCIVVGSLVGNLVGSGSVDVTWNGPKSNLGWWRTVLVFIC